MLPMTHLLTTLLMLTLTLHGAAMAGPVAAGEADAASAGTTTTGVVSPAATGGSSAATVGAGHGLGQLGRTADAASAPTGSALMLEMLKEAEADAPGHEAVRQPRREGERAASASAANNLAAAQPIAGDDPWGLRDIGKTAVRWAKHTMPWLRSEDDEADAAKEVVLKQADWSASPLGGDPHRGAGSVGGAGAFTQPQAELGYGEAKRTPQASTEFDLVRQIVEVVRVVLEHPMTWLVAALFVIGGIVVRKIDRRPK